MPDTLIAIVGDISPSRTFDPPMQDPVTAKRAAEELGTELARRGVRLLVYGGPYLEADVVRGFVAGKPTKDHSILMSYSKGYEPNPFPEEGTHPRLFRRNVERGADWEVAFYRSVARAHGVILMGGASSTKNLGQVAIGARIPILALAKFGGGAAKVWETLSAGEDLPNREEITLMGAPWAEDSAAKCVQALLAQRNRKRLAESAARPATLILVLFLFVAAIATIPWLSGWRTPTVWALFIAPLLAGGSGAALRPIVDWRRGTPGIRTTVPTVVVLGMVAGGISGALFVFTQLSADPKLRDAADFAALAPRSIVVMVCVGFLAGLTSDRVFGKLLGLDVVKTGDIGS